MASDTKAVFISYRRDAGAGYAGRIADALVEHFGEDKVFRDIDSLEPGLDFAEAIERAIESSEVLIAVIGKNWLTATDAAGQKRLENPDDYVRTEIATALKRNIRVIPLLIQGAAMPSARELPDDLAPLNRRNAFEIHDSSWRDDIRRLVTRPTHEIVDTWLSQRCHEIPSSVVARRLPCRGTEPAATRRDGVADGAHTRPT
jgi:TIR domain